MRKQVLTVIITVASFFTASAEQKNIYMIIHGEIKPRHTQVDRTPIRQPVLDVVYDSDLSTIIVSGSTSVDGVITIYNNNGIIVGTADSINATIQPTMPGPYLIRIDGDGWYAIGNIDV